MSGTLALTIFKGVFGFDIDKKLISIISYFLSFFYWPVNCATTVYKLYIAFQTQSETRTLLLLDYIVTFHLP